MEKDFKKKNKKDDITKIYETIQGKEFIEDLWLDALSDIKEKPSYIRLKNMVDNAIGSSVEKFALRPTNEEERLQTRTIFSRLSIMTYTIDTLISQILYKKLNDEFKSIISNIVNEVKTKPTSSESAEQNKSINMLENIGELLCNQNGEEHRNPVNDQNCKMKYFARSKNCHGHVKTSSKVLPDEQSDIDVTTVSDDDALSIDDNCSIRSDVSSVHTSDLSSFEDNISISSEDEDGRKIKKHVSLKLANDLYNSGELSGLHNMCKTKRKTKLSPKSHSKKLNDFPKKLTGRIRKLNSKYSSDDVICSIKPLLAQVESPTSHEVNVVKQIYSKEKELSKPENGIRRGRPPKMFNSVEPVNTLIINSSSKSSDSGVGQQMNAKMSNISKNESVAVFEPLPKRERKPKLYKDFEVERTNDFIYQNAVSPEKQTLKLNVTSAKSSTLESERKPKRGRPVKKASSEEESSDSEATISLSNSLKRTIDSKTEHEVKRKRGRPLKKNESVLVKSSFNNENTSSGEDRRIRKPAFQKETILNSTESETNNELMVHSIESFSRLEESLCLKDKISQSSPSRSSTKSYEKSDLYKPHSDFRISLNSSRSRALTLYSN